MRIPKSGDEYRVKSTNSLRKYGLHCRYDAKAWPREVGTVVVCKIPIREGEYREMRIEFSDKRTARIGMKWPDPQEWIWENETLSQLAYIKGRKP